MIGQDDRLGHPGHEVDEIREGPWKVEVNDVGASCERRKFPDCANGNAGRIDLQIAMDAMNGMIIEACSLVAGVRTEGENLDVVPAPADPMCQLEDELFDASVGIRSIRLEEVQNSQDEFQVRRPGDDQTRVVSLSLGCIDCKMAGGVNSIGGGRAGWLLSGGLDIGLGSVASDRR